MGLEVRAVRSHLQVTKTLFQALPSFPGSQTCLTFEQYCHVLTGPIIHSASVFWDFMPYNSGGQLSERWEPHFRRQIRQEPHKTTDNFNEVAVVNEHQLCKIQTFTVVQW